MTAISVTSHAPRKRGRPRDPSADARILSAAVELLLEHGFEAMTVDDVAARAHVGKATVYRRWASKDELAAAAVEQLYAQEFEIADTGNLRDDLIATTKPFLAFANTEQGYGYLRTLLTESLRDDNIRELSRSAGERNKAAGLALYQRALERGEMRADADPNWALMMIVGLVVSAIGGVSEMPSATETEGLVDLLLYGIVPR